MPFSLSPEATLPFLDQLGALNREVADLLDHTPAEQLAHAVPGRWSALQSIEHVTLTNVSYIPLVERALNSTTQRESSAVQPFQYSWFERFFINATEPPPGIRVPIPDSKVRPEPTSDVPGVRARYLAAHDELAKLVDRSANVDLRRVRINSPFLMRPSASLGLLWGTLFAHERRHLFQARRAVDDARRSV